MKVYYKILGLIFFAVLLLGCTKSAISDESGEIDINTDRNYIRFDSGISTRGALFMKDYLDANFNVLGYQYPGTWEAASSMATPNVFQSTPQLVTHSDGIYTYSPIKAWTGNTYSFFGFYPSNSSYIEIFDNGTAKEGIPYITYTVPTSADPSDLIDIMTASVINTDIDVSPDVRLNMRHRLSAIDIGARNYYVQKITNGETEESHIVTIEITSLEMQVKTYTSAKIYLDGTTATTGTGSQTLEYQMVASATDIAPNSTDDTALRLITTDTGENATSVILVPQSNILEGKLSMKYKKKYKNDNNSDFVYIGNEEYVEVDLATLGRSLAEGRRYTIEFTFTSDAVSINISVVDEWDEINKDDLKHEFE